MKKFQNKPSRFVEDYLRGMLNAHDDFYRSDPQNIRAIVLRRPQDSSVSIVIGGGTGHLPLFPGYVGEGLCAGVAVGDVFSSPGNEAIAWVTREVPHGRGVLYIAGNYTGDLMNFEMAAREVRAEGIETRMVIVSDDAATAPRERWRERRTIAGIALIYKMTGAAARRGMSLEEIAEVAEYANQRLVSLGMAFESCQLPDTDSPIFSIGEAEMEIGIGIHGEPGVRRSAIIRSAEIADMTVSLLREELELSPGDAVTLLVNNLGAASQEELYLLYGDLRRAFERIGVAIVRKYIGAYATSLGMNGASITGMKTDETLLSLLDDPCYSPLVRF